MKRGNVSFSNNGDSLNRKQEIMMSKIIFYDFDGTLTPYSMPKYEILEKCGLKDGTMNPKFKELAREILPQFGNIYQAMHQTYFNIIKNAGELLIDSNFTLGADKVTYNKGVFEFLELLNNNDVTNYILSSGILVYLEKTTIAKYFEHIYATTFKYDENKEVIGLDYLMSDEKKVDIIKEIAKRHDFKDIIYIGDGLTDYYAMEYVKQNGGTVIFVYQDKNNKDISIMQEKNIVDIFTEADFSPNSELTTFVKRLCKIK